MNPVSLLIASLWKFLVVVGAMGITATSIGLLVKGAIKKGVIKTRCNNVVHAVKTKNKSKTKKAYQESERLTEKVDERSRVASEATKKVKTPRTITPVNSEAFAQEGKKASSSLATPGLKRLVEDYFSKTDLKGEKSFTGVKISYASNSNLKNEELTAPANFVEYLFIPKAIYECAIGSEVAYPVTITYGAGKNESGENVERVITLEDREQAKEIAIERLAHMDPRMVAKAEMDIAKLTAPAQDMGNEK